ncbi:MAG: metallophosphoesterase [Bryobacteraceae bacterium]
MRFLIPAFLVSGVMLGADTLSITNGPYLQIDSGASVAVTWITDRPAAGVVEYGLAGGELKPAFSSHHGLVDTGRVHHVVLKDLQPGATYRYRVASREILTPRPGKLEQGATVRSEFREFRALDPGKREFSFLVFNDMHDVPATFPELLKAAGAAPYDFVLLNGDIVSHVANEAQVTKMLDAAAASFASSAPFLWVRGNHETRGPFARQLPAYLHLPDSRYYRGFDYGGVRFTILDTGEDKIDEHPEYGGLADFFRYRREQAEWLKAEVASAAFRSARYRIVVCHMPFSGAARQSGGSGSAPSPFQGMADGYRNFGATLEQANVDLMISGHLHSSAVADPVAGRHRYPIVRGGGPKDPSRTVIRVTVTGEGIEARILRADGSGAGTCRVSPRR